MRMFRLALLALALLAPAPALAQTPGDCDRLAGYPMNARQPGFPAAARILDAEAAVAACEAARASDPDPFLAFLLARALEAQDAQDPRLQDLIAEGAAASAPFAASRLGLLHTNGHGGLAQDPARGRALFAESCAALPDRHALAGCNNLAAAMTAPEERAEADALFQRACEAGFGVACSNLAQRIEAGTAPGAEALDPLALRQRGCEGNDPQACLHAGYAMTIAEPPQNDAAIRHFTRACDLGEPDGCYRLGVVLLERGDAPRDWQGALQAFDRGCAGGNGDTDPCYEYALGLAYGDDAGGIVPEASGQTEALALFDQLCTRGHAPSCTDTGYLYGQGLGTAVDAARGAALSARACTLGSGMGCNNLAVHLATGDGVARSAARAARYYERSCTMGTGLACLNLADMLTSGELGELQPNRARALYRKACDLGEAEACTHLE